MLGDQGLVLSSHYVNSILIPHILYGLSGCEKKTKLSKCTFFFFFLSFFLFFRGGGCVAGEIPRVSTRFLLDGCVWLCQGVLVEYVVFVL